MGIRETLANNPAVGVVIAIIVVGLAVTFLSRSLAGPQRFGENGVYYYDLETRELFTAALDNTPPIPAPSGGQGVIAYVYTCATCSPADREILYLEKYGDEARTLLTAEDDGDQPQMDAKKVAAIQSGLLLAKVPAGSDEPKWIVANTPEGIALLNTPEGRCDGKRAKRCNP